MIQWWRSFCILLILTKLTSTEYNKTVVRGCITVRTVDLFCGCGGLSLGFQNCGYKIIGAFDFWQPAIDCYNANFNHRAHILDLSKKNTSLKTISQLNPEIIIGGPPCQDFSSAGERKEGARANLTVSFAKIVKSLKPQYFVMENVSQVRSSTAYKEARALFKAAGYGLTEQVLDASRCGVPQKRKRFFCVGALKAQDNFLDSYLGTNQSVFPLTMRKYFTDNQYELTFDYYYRHPRTYSRRAIFSVDEPAPTIRGVNRPKPPEYKPHSNDAAPPNGIDSLTSRQRALLQTFPLNFKFNESQMISDQLIGNAVPVNLAAHVARALLCFDHKIEIECSMSFSGWLQSTHQYSVRAAKDVVSRLNRCNKIVQINRYSFNEYLTVLEDNENFKKLSKSIRSQLKRALNLYDEYNKRPRQ